MASRFHIDVDKDADPEISAALDLAIGASLPVVVAHWPVGLVNSWNTAAEGGYFDQAKTLGDLARAYLKWRLERLAGRAKINDW